MIVSLFRPIVHLYNIPPREKNIHRKYSANNSTCFIVLCMILLKGEISFSFLFSKCLQLCINLEHSQWICQKPKSTQIWLISLKNGSQWMSYTLCKIEKWYSVKTFMSYTVHWANEYFIISFVLRYLFILFSFSPALSLSLFFFTGCHLSLLFLLLFLILLLLLLLLLLQIGDGDGDGVVCDFALMCWCCSGFDDFL